MPERKTHILDRYIRTDFVSHEDFLANYKAHPPKDFNFAYDVLDTLADQQPNKLALLWTNDQGDEKHYNFAEIRATANQYANALKELGLKKGDPILVMLKRRAEYWFFTLAAHKLGLELIPATHMLTKKDLVYRVKAAQIRFIFTIEDAQLCDSVRAAQTECADILQTIATYGEAEGFVDLPALAAQASTSWTVPTGEAYSGGEDRFISYFTSGTTGMPKLVRHNHFYAIAHIVTAKFWHNLNADDLHLTVADTGWGKASWGKLYGQWFCESAVFVYDYDTRFHPTDFLKLIDKYHITSFCAPPTIYRFLIKEDLSAYSLKSLKKCTIAGEPLNPEIYNRWLEVTGLKLREGFGQTETVTIIGNTPWIEPKPGSMGKSLPGLFADIYTADGTVVEPGEEGEICVPIPDGKKPYGLFMNYANDPALYNSVVYNGLYHTGDTAWKDEDGYFWFKGRSDDIIKSSGYRIGPFEVESALLEHPAVRESAVTGIPDPVRGLSVKASVILQPGYAGSDALIKELQDHVKRLTAPYKYPRVIEFVEELPKTISGKIRRAQIREEDAK
jgi:acetyl-CoA synthetase